MFMKFFTINILILFFSTISIAEIIKNVNVNGNQRISKESIIVFGKIKFDLDYKKNDLNIILKNLYDTDFFDKVSLTISNSTLNIDVVENPIIESLEINGISSTKLSELLLDKINLKSRKSYIQSSFLSDLNLIKNIIKSSGYYFADIKTSSIKNSEQNSIRLIYDIDLGKKARISEIQFLGDKRIKDRKLRNIITSKEHRFWKFISTSSYLNTANIELDKRLLTNFYKDRGYYNVEITNSYVEFKNDGDFKLIYNINSGNKFTFNKLDLILTEKFEKEYFKGIIKSLAKLQNKTYSLNDIEKVLRAVDKIALSKQFEFINANLTEKIISDNKINISISLEETKKFYVEKINILGNQFTLEEVIRNAFIVDEGDPYNEILFNKSMNKIRSKNIFAKVESTILPGSNDNLKIVDIRVEEKPTGEISLGAGIGTSGGTIAGGIKENNFLGKGIGLNTNLQISADKIQGAFTYSKPNFNNSDNTLFSTLRSTSTDLLTTSGYKSNNLGVSLGTSFEQYQSLFFSPELSLSMEELETNSTATATQKKQAGNYFDAYFNYGLIYDQRNRNYKPDAGYINSFTQEIPLISDSLEIVNSFETAKYLKYSEMVTKISFYAKAANTLDGGNVRLSKRLYLPESKLRGFESGKVGPFKNNDYLGGNYVSSVNIVTTLPQIFPSMQSTDFSIFLDTANIWGVDYDSSFDENSKIKSAAGVAMDVLTPIGPLNFSLSQAISKASKDKTETFRFNLGTTF